MTKLKTVVVNVGRSSLGFLGMDENILSSGIDVGHMRGSICQYGMLKFMHFHVYKLHSRKNNCESLNH